MMGLDLDVLWSESGGPHFRHCMTAIDFLRGVLGWSGMVLEGIVKVPKVGYRNGGISRKIIYTRSTGDGHINGNW